MKVVPEISLSLRNISIWANLQKGFFPFRSTNLAIFNLLESYNKMILNDISCDFVSGTSTAILGPSGSGKTTLLNFIASRIKSSNLSVKGDLQVNRRSVESIKQFKHRFSYVMQDDVLFEDLTVYEQLYSTAQLAGIDKREETVKEVMTWLNLHKCKNTKIGGAFNKGLSGGEKKRVSIATEMLTNPSVIFLDEPTTGLDS